MAARTPTTAEERAARRLRNVNGFLWHATTFLIINGFLWFIDLVNGDLDFAYWVSICWGVGLAFHLAAMLIGEDDESSPRYQRILQRERQDELL